jgi:glucan phosphoethanolaminetransferase (alkaline phosphatase superfamily)
MSSDEVFSMKGILWLVLFAVAFALCIIGARHFYKYRFSKKSGIALIVLGVGVFGSAALIVLLLE